MDKQCDHNCSDCNKECAEKDLKEKPNQHSKINKVIAVMSGKGGVGKSLITSMLAVMANREGLDTSILDADITGPSIPKTFGLDGKADACDAGIFPIKSRFGIKIMSINLLLEKETDPVIWRGPMIAGIVKQFWTDVIWDYTDIMLIDMPPGTGDVPLTVFQSIPVDGIIIVTSPQELVSMIVSKAVIMAEKMNVPILGIVENMSYAECPKCGERINVFGESNLNEIAEKYNLDILGKIPLNPKLSAACDKGMIELFDGNYLDKVLIKIKTLLN